MKSVTIAVLIAAFAAPAAAQSMFGDTRLSYQNGVVYDDDLVPGRGQNTPFLIEEQSPQGNRLSDPADDDGAVRQSSPSLVGPDGRAIRAR